MCKTYLYKPKNFKDSLENSPMKILRVSWFILVKIQFTGNIFELFLKSLLKSISYAIGLHISL